LGEYLPQWERVAQSHAAARKCQLRIRRAQQCLSINSKPPGAITTQRA